MNLMQINIEQDIPPAMHRIYIESELIHHLEAKMAQLLSTFGMKQASLHRIRGINNTF